MKLNKLNKNNKLHKEGFEAGYKKGRRDREKEIAKEIRPRLNIIKANIDASQDFVSNPVSKKAMRDILNLLTRSKK